MSEPGMIVLETERLVLRWLGREDGPFILELLNDPDFLRHIGDRGVRSVEDAIGYIEKGPVAMYHRYGFGLYLVILRETGESIGICGLVKRDSLPDVDVGFAFLPRFRSRGFGLESALAVRDYGLKVVGLKRLVAITVPENAGSIALLEKIGLRFERMVKLSADEPEIRLYALDVDKPATTAATA